MFEIQNGAKNVLILRLCFFFLCLYVRFRVEGVIGSSILLEVSSSKSNINGTCRRSFFESFLTCKVIWNKLTKNCEKMENKKQRSSTKSIHLFVVIQRRIIVET